MILTGRRITADQALACGLVNRVVPARTALEGARALAADILGGLTHLGAVAGCHFRMLTARATTRATVTIETAACTVMAIFAQRDSGMTSVGLKAAALVNERYR